MLVSVRFAEKRENMACARGGRGQREAISAAVHGGKRHANASPGERWAFQLGFFGGAGNAHVTRRSLLSVQNVGWQFLGVILSSVVGLFFWNLSSGCGGQSQAGPGCGVEVRLMAIMTLAQAGRIFLLLWRRCGPPRFVPP